MPVAAGEIYIRTFLDLVKKLAPCAAPNGSRPPSVVIVCDSCGLRTNFAEIRVLVCGLFHCKTCFLKLVRNQKLAFGVSEAATDEGVLDLLKPYEFPEGRAFTTNLYELKVTPRFVCVHAASTVVSL